MLLSPQKPVASSTGDRYATFPRQIENTPKLACLDRPHRSWLFLCLQRHLLYCTSPGTRCQRRTWPADTCRASPIAQTGHRSTSRALDDGPKGRAQPDSARPHGNPARPCHLAIHGGPHLDGAGRFPRLRIDCRTGHPDSRPAPAPYTTTQPLSTSLTGFIWTHCPKVRIVLIPFPGCIQCLHIHRGLLGAASACVPAPISRGPNPASERRNPAEDEAPNVIE